MDRPACLVRIGWFSAELTNRAQVIIVFCLLAVAEDGLKSGSNNLWDEDWKRASKIADRVIIMS